MRIEEVRLACLDRARSMYPEADPDALTRIAERFASFVAFGNTLVVGQDDAGNATVRPLASGYRPDLDPFTETETARMMGVV